MTSIAWRVWLVCLAASAAATGQTPSPVPLRLIQRIPLPGVEGRMDHMSVDAKGQRLFASGLANGTVEVIDLAAGKQVRSIAGVKEPEGLLFAPDLNTLFVADGEGNAVHAFDGTSFKPLRVTSGLPHSDNLRYDAVAQRLYVGFGDGADAGIGIVEAADGALVGVINLDSHPEAFSFEKKAGKRIFVNVPIAGAIAVIDSGKRRVVTKWPIQEVKNFYPMAFDEANQRLFIGSRRPAKLVVLDTKSGLIVTTMDGASDTDDLFYDPTHKRVYMSGGDGTVRVFAQRDPDHYDALAKIPTGPGARISLLVPELNRYYVAVPRRGSHSAEIMVFELEP
jgi:DNA-binding beta-propeller fold protein YncE